MTEWALPYLKRGKYFRRRHRSGNTSQVKPPARFTASNRDQLCNSPWGMPGIHFIIVLKRKTRHTMAKLVLIFSGKVIPLMNLKWGVRFPKGTGIITPALKLGASNRSFKRQISQVDSFNIPWWLGKRIFYFFFIFLFFYFETGFLYKVLASLELTMLTILTSNSHTSSCLCLPCAGIQKDL